MDLNELQSARDRERQTDKLQQLRESFYADAGAFIGQLRAERDRAVERAGDPFDSPEVRQLTDEIETAEQTVEAIYENRVGKLVKNASFAAADMPVDTEGMTAEEQALFDRLVDDIKHNRARVLALLDGDAGDDSRDDSTATDTADADGAVADSRANEPRGSPPTREDDPSPPKPDEESPPGRAKDGPPGSDRPAAGMSRADDERPGAGTDSSGNAGDVENAGDTEDDPGRASRRMAAADVMGNPADAGGEEHPDPATPAPTDSAGHRTDRDAHLGQTHSGDLASEQQTERPVRKDGGTEETSTESRRASPEGATTESGDVERRQVQVLEEVETFLGFDDRDYDLEPDDVVSLPATNADILLERGVAREL